MTRVSDNALWFPRTASTLGAVYILAGRPAEARTSPRRGARADDGHGAHPPARADPGLARRGDPGGRPPDRSRGSWPSTPSGWRGTTTSAGTKPGRCACSARSDRARRPPISSSGAQCYRQAQARAEALGMRPLVAHALLGLGMLGGAERSTAQARECLETARALFRSMGMDSWLARAGPGHR